MPQEIGGAPSQRQDLNVRLLERYDEIALLLPRVIEASDANRQFLGFIPRNVFHELARQHEIFVVASEQDDGKLRYLGHLLFARRYPKARILQLFVDPDYRGRQLSRLLCDRLTHRLTLEGFTSVYARVAEDMHAANAVWQAMGFRVQRLELGGVSTGRTIVVRVRELDSPQLFPTRRAGQDDPLGVGGVFPPETPLYLLDLNVLFDLSPRRARHEEALTLFQAERANFCRLAISEEMINELERTGIAGQPDAMMNLARTFTRFPISKANESNPNLTELARIVFPHKAVTNLTKNDRSDLSHLVTAIDNCLTGLVTNDGTILAAGQLIEERFGVQVLSPKAFAPDDSAPHGATSFESGGMQLELTSCSSDEGLVRGLLTSLGLTGSELASGWITPAANAFAAKNAGSVVGFVTWPALRPNSTCIIRVAVNETVPHAANVARGLVMRAINSNVDGPTRLQIQTPPNQVIVREIALGLGFRGTHGTRDLRKLSCGRVATRSNWDRIRAELAGCGLKMDTHFPKYRQMEQLVPYTAMDGGSEFETLETIETLISPALFCFPGRPAVITPIQHQHSQRLLGHSRQADFLPASSSQLFHERFFISGPNAFKYLKRGTLMLFYESRPPRGKGELVAIARVRRSFLKEMDAFGDSDLVQSVLSRQTLADIGSAEIKCVTVFDNLFALENPVSLARLQALDCGAANDLITTHPIFESQLQTILTEAFKA